MPEALQGFPHRMLLRQAGRAEKSPARRGRMGRGLIAAGAILKFREGNKASTGTGREFLGDFLLLVRNILTFVQKFGIMARTTTVALGAHYENFIQSTIISGRFNNTSEVVRAALRLLEEDETRLAALRAAIDDGDSSPDIVNFDRESLLTELKARNK